MQALLTRGVATQALLMPATSGLPMLTSTP
jgi:hypothetical protein